ncbi:MAG: ABC transporter substrate-binding protein [Neomegalonema sp.]|nr:ABC transporter substrate-binding protein [Neomegalonema sp.]
MSVQAKTVSIFTAAAIALGMAVVGVIWGTQRQAAPFVVGVLHPTKNDIATFEGFKSKMRALGYVEGKDVVFLYDGPAGRGEKLEAAARRLVKAKVDLIFASSTPATLAAKRATEGADVAVVFGPVNDPIAAKVVPSLNRPGGNVTGVKLPRSGAKRFKWLVDLNPAAKSVLAPYNPEDMSSLASLEQAKEAAAALGVELVQVEVRSPADVKRLLASLPPKIGGIFLPRDAMITAQLSAFQKAGLAYGAPVSAPGLKHVNLGAFVSYGFAHFAVGERAAELADKIRNGAAPGELPIETAESFLALNLKTAKALGLEVPERFLKHARMIVR